MVIRAIIRDIISIYLGYKIIKGAIYSDFSITTTVLIAAIVLLVLSIWILLERMGILQKIT